MGRLAEMQRKLLEQMMGPEAMGVANANLVWSDEKVCRNFLCGTCPHALFTNTKMDLGACPKSHTERLKTEFNTAKTEDSNNPIFNRFQMEYESNIFAFVDECDRRIRAAHRRLEKTPEENAKTTNLMREIAEIELAIQGGTEKIETLGEQGKVDESMREMAAIEALKSEKAEKERDLQQLTDTSGASGHQKLRVCDVCGAYLSVLDSDRRLADHFGGKMHLGYHELRNMLQKFREEREQRKMAPPSAPTPSGPPGGPPARSGGERGGDYRSSRGDDYRDRDRGAYDRHGSSSRYDSDRRRDRERSRSPGRRSFSGVKAEKP
ncbi:LUC7-domain-containing protein [Athelia psychrophila]|uniref:LUC7-domain-containing protein n=1 Tax=Athelia psychrophila TaxID=1759441 RepID=A0A166BG46_9AGAM|nr:LUC7-domain-containing protein [Fibularhizoctonia sp. CBS 109695]